MNADNTALNKIRWFHVFGLMESGNVWLKFLPLTAIPADFVSAKPLNKLFNPTLINGTGLKN